MEFKLYKTFSSLFLQTPKSFSTAAAAIKITEISVTLTTLSHEDLRVKLKTAMKDKEKVQVAVIKGLMSDLLNSEKSGSSKPLSISAIIQQNVKKRKDSISSYEKGNRNDLVSNEQKELDFLVSLLPKQLSEKQVYKIVTDVVEKSKFKGIKDLGKLMKVLTDLPELDSSLVSKQNIASTAKLILTSLPSKADPQ